MTNAPFRDISDFRDLDSINAYQELTGQGVFTKEEMLCHLRKKSRDNARTPFQWSDDANAGFTTGNPWIMVNPNYREINAREQLAREDSVFHYYQKPIRLRKAPVMVYGSYDLLLPEDPDSMSTPGLWMKKRCWSSAISPQSPAPFPFRKAGAREKWNL